ncbi:response regulator [Paenibacillus oryzisoli]|uniref:response regulator transcription factor n=1 Tax=Paenibacillus oryzisoli TaxID=1850517 RepID=UPI003D266A57
MNVLVVDDEPIIRQGLRELVDWQRHGFTFAGDAEDGLEASELLEDLHIDIVITDLLMPRMDGLTLIRKLKESPRPISAVVLSCMDEFTYVKEAMRLGAKDYILKPTMEPESLIEILLGVKQDLEILQNERQAQSLRELELASTLQMQRATGVQSYLQAGIGEAELQERFYDASWNRRVALAPEDASTRTITLPYDIRSDLLRCIVHDNSEGCLHHAERLCTKLREQRHEKEKVLLFIQELLALAAGYARERGYAEIERYEELFVHSHATSQCVSFEQVTELLQQAMSMLMQQPGRPGPDQKTRSNHPFIRKVVSYMRDNYASPISTSDMADHVRLSRSYLSDLYSKEMGESLSESLTRIRMEEAMQRLRTGEMKVYEVAEAVGFPDAKTFAKTFKRVVGCSPKEFEKLI